jgi:hypothetical protein
MAKRKDVVAGQSYRRIGGGGGVWQVISIGKDSMGMVHAKLRREDDPNTLKTLCVSTVLDREQFEPLD